MTTELMIPKTPFMHLCREIIDNVATVKGWSDKPALQIQFLALGTLQEVMETFLVSNFESEYLITYSL